MFPVHLHARWRRERCTVIHRALRRGCSAATRKAGVFEPVLLESDGDNLLVSQREKLLCHVEGMSVQSGPAPLA